MPSLSQLLAYANQEFTDVYNRGPYTSYKQIKFLLLISGKSFNDLIADPKGVFRDLTYDTILDACIAASADVEATWKGKAGRCTATSLKVSDQLMRKYPGQFEFEYFSVRRGKVSHRFSRCALTGIVIDVICSMGAFILPDNELRTITTMYTLSWGHQDGNVYMIDEDGMDQFCEKVSHVRAQALCLYEVSRSGQLVVLFRELNPQFLNQNISGYEYKTAMFPHGCIKFKLKPDSASGPGLKQLHLTPNPDDPGDKTIIVWSQDHTDQDRGEAQDEVHYFLATWTGCHANRQWPADGINWFYRELFWQLCLGYGNPKILTKADAEYSLPDKGGLGLCTC
ncbi:unnamed protein product [Fusarium graminearum]|nr:unnamed protein product [Fusarium graminearum]